MGEGEIPPSLCVDEDPTNDDTSVIILLFQYRLSISNTNRAPIERPHRETPSTRGERGKEEVKIGEKPHVELCKYITTNTHKRERALGIPIIILYTLGPHNTTHNQRGHNSRIDIDVRDGLFANGRIVTFCVFCVWNKF